jgi:hypothetical protein
LSEEEVNMKSFTVKQLAKMREQGVESIVTHAGAFGGRVIDPKTVKFTCDKCKAAPNCEWAFDDYNTNGDCLAEK